MSVNRSDNLAAINAIKSAGFSDKVALVLSIWFGLGLLPGMPGTFGTAGAIPVYLLLVYLGAGYKVLFLAIIIILAVWSSGRSQCILGRTDPREIVIDEVAGFLLTVIFLPFTWITLLAGFFLFRFFDILKPPPIRRIEEKLTNGFGIVMDDLMAGIYAHLCLRLLLLTQIMQ
jgi:phosphatidylglycerophosphatase A